MSVPIFRASMKRVCWRRSRKPRLAAAALFVFAEPVGVFEGRVSKEVVGVLIWIKVALRVRHQPVLGFKAKIGGFNACCFTSHSGKAFQAK